jgi:glycosyltransferase involved in cell wall biosynthesis
VLGLGNSIVDAISREFEIGSRGRVLPNFVGLPSEIADLPQEPTIVAIGRMGNRKGTYVLLEAIELLLSQGIPFKARLLGDGDVDRVRDTVRHSIWLSSAVDVLGWKSPEEVTKAIDAAWCVVLPSFAEGLPMTILEGMARGRCAVSTGVGSVPDVIADYENGLLVEPGSVDQLAAALKSIVVDRPFARSLGRAARITIKNSYTESVILGQLVKIYSDASAREPKV